MPVYQTTQCSSGITAGLSASSQSTLGPTASARITGYAFNANNPNGVGDPANVAAPSCILQGPVFGTGFYFPQVNPGVVTPKLVP